MYGGSLPTPFFTFPLPIPSREGLSTRDLMILTSAESGIPLLVDFVLSLPHTDLTTFQFQPITLAFAYY